MVSEKESKTRKLLQVFSRRKIGNVKTYSTKNVSATEKSSNSHFGRDRNAYNFQKNKNSVYTRSGRNFANNRGAKIFATKQQERGAQALTRLMNTNMTFKKTLLFERLKFSRNSASRRNYHPRNQRNPKSFQNQKHWQGQINFKKQSYQDRSKHFYKQF